MHEEMEPVISTVAASLAATIELSVCTEVCVQENNVVVIFVFSFNAGVCFL